MTYFVREISAAHRQSVSEGTFEDYRRPGARITPGVGVAGSN
jgi:hypothetical protein